LCVGCLAWRITRATQMVTQYNWLYERTSPVTWRDRAAIEEAPGKG
jgi:ethanolamine utilization protein EutP (predicted NTPase)